MSTALMEMQPSLRRQPRWLPRQTPFCTRRSLRIFSASSAVQAFAAGARESAEETSPTLQSEAQLPRTLFRARMRLIVNLENVFHRKLRVALRRSQALVTEKFLDRAQVSTFLEHVRAKCVAKRVGMNIR